MDEELIIVNGRLGGGRVLSEGTAKIKFPRSHLMRRKKMPGLGHERQQ